MHITPIHSILSAQDADVAQLLQRYISQSLPTLIQNINAYLAQKQWLSLQHEVHRLKGSGGGYGFPMVSEVCHQIEKEIAHEHWPAVAERVAELNQYYQRICLPDECHVGATK
ncbi:MAG: Hpt domain-containing protein [Pseudomonadota bacterium]